MARIKAGKLTLIVCFHMWITLNEAKEPDEYCQDDAFTASCRENEVVLMESARYGRMRLGQCVKSNLGFLGCAVDVRRFMDSRCSGKRECTVSIMDPVLRNTKPCSSELAWYLEATHSCMKVESITQRRCQQGKGHIRIVSSDKGLLSSMAALQAGVGSTLCPWRIEALPGQKINFTLYNFLSSLTAESAEVGQSSELCYKVAAFKDGGRRQAITACSSEPRFKTVFLSERHLVEVEFISRSSMPDAGPQFLLQYEVLGCANMSLPKGMLSSRDSNTLKVTCENTGEIWYLTCEKNAWHGQLGNCSGEHVAQEWTIGNIFNDDTSFPYGILIVVAVGVALGVFLGGTLLIFVSLYMKRRRRGHMDDTPYMDRDDFDVQGPQHPRDVDCKIPEYGTHKVIGMDIHTLHRLPTESSADVERPQYRVTGVPSNYTGEGRLLNHVYESPHISQ